MKPFLKWPGGKYRLIKRIRKVLNGGQRLIEPFAGSAAVFLNTDFEDYILADTNSDLIQLYQHLVDEGNDFIRYCQTFFSDKNNIEERFYQLRDEFNRSGNDRRKAALFLYLNRHCYNGLCRYNSKGRFNTPFGRYGKPYFPAKEMERFIDAAGKATFLNTSFHDSMRLARAGDTVYCDPPYAPLSNTANFTDYHANGFSWEDQLQLAQTACELAGRGVQVVISNHDTRPVRTLYKNAGAKIRSFQASRTISCNVNNRKKVGELLAIFS